LIRYKNTVNNGQPSLFKSISGIDHSMQRKLFNRRNYEVCDKRIRKQRGCSSHFSRWAKSVNVRLKLPAVAITKVAKNENHIRKVITSNVSN